MSFSRRHLLATLGASSLLGACGFRPMYRDVPGEVDAVDAFRSIDILPVEETAANDFSEGPTGRTGQLLRNHLLDVLQPRGRVADPVYRLRVRLSESKSSLAVRKSAFATRANLRLAATVHLYDRRTEAEILQTHLRVVSSYNILQSEYGTLIAERDARENAVRSLSEEIRLRLGSFLADESV